MERYLPPLSEHGRRWVRFLALVAAAWLLVYLVIYLRAVLTPVAAALAIAYILNPAVGWLERRFGVRRIVSISIGLIALAGLAALLALVATIQLIQLAESVQLYARHLLGWLFETFPQLFRAPDPDQPSTAPAAGREQLAQVIQQYGGSVGSTLLSTATALVGHVGYALTLIVLIPLYTFFFLLSFERFKQAVQDHLPAAYRPTIVRVATTIDTSISNFFRGRIVVCTIVGLLMGFGWMIVGVSHNLLLGALAGVLNLVPFLSLLAVPPALLLAYAGTEPGTSWVMPVVLAMCVYLAVQAIESFLLTPLIEARSSGLHPVTTVIALLIGGKLAGLLGMLLAIPIASTLKSLGREYLLPEIRRLAAVGGEPPAAGPGSSEKGAGSGEQGTGKPGSDSSG